MISILLHGWIGLSTHLIKARELRLSKAIVLTTPVKNKNQRQVQQSHTNNLLH
jgi:hypothetical protein